MDFSTYPWISFVYKTIFVVNVVRLLREMTDYKRILRECKLFKNLFESIY